MNSLHSLIASWAAASLLLLSGCAAPSGPLYDSAPKLAPYAQASFQDYVRETRAWIAVNRHFLTDDRGAELETNTPFELRPAAASPTRGVLLIHGLGDSPGYFEDVAEALVDENVLVRAMLLPGHGTKPGDLKLPAIEDWRAAVAHQVELLSAQVDEVWLGGFSTGANLATAYALERGGVSGLLLFSPGFVPQDSLLWLAPFASLFVDWVDIDAPTLNFMRYESLSTNAAALYYRTTQDVRSALKARTLDVPALLVMTEHDSVIDPAGVLDLFERRFTAEESRFIWYGDDPGSMDKRVAVKTSRLPDQRISSFSHLCVMFSPDHPYYGRDGAFVMLENGQDADPAAFEREEFWYSAHGLNEPGKYHARLTWNPYFNELKAAMREVMAGR